MTVFYDAFRSADGAYAILLGPPLLNLKASVVPSLVRAFEVGEAKHAVLRRLSLNDQLWLRTSRELAALPVGAFEESALTVQPNHSHLFRGKRVLLTKSRDNELQWIADWARFHAAHHGTNAIVLYDNASSKYETEEVRKCMLSVKNIDEAVVVNWPYKFGPLGDAGQWDSNFSEHAILEHARHRFLASAHSVVCGDIDELVVSEKKGASLHDLAAQSTSGYLKYAGHWIENATTNAGSERRHSDYVYRLASSPCEPKWTVVPNRCPLQAQWLVHQIAQMVPDAVLSEIFRIRHFKAISTNWRAARYQPEVPASGKHVPDEALIAAFRELDATSANA